MRRIPLGVLLLPAIMSIWGCQSPTSPSDTIDYDDVVDASAAPPSSPTLTRAVARIASCVATTNPTRSSRTTGMPSSR